jgi:hypothetical protein
VIHKSEYEEATENFNLVEVGWKIVIGLLEDHKVFIFTEKNLI